MKARRPARIMVRIRRVEADVPYPYRYTIDGLLPGEEEPAYIDYGAVESIERVRECVTHTLANRHEADNMDLYHVGVKGERA